MVKKLVVLFTGAHSTGKTTTIYRVTEKLATEHKIIAGGSRFLKEIDMIDNTDTKATATEQMLINAELLMKYYETTTSDVQLFISERTPICVFSYASILKGMPSYVLEYNRRFLETTLARDDIEILTIYFPTNIPFVEDEVRVYSSRAPVDEAIRNILREYNIEYHTMLTTDLDERTNNICSLINQRLIELGE